jgi:sugar phosphate isomerase/epimerase
VRLGIGSYAFAWACGVPGYPPAVPLTQEGFLQRASDLGVGLVQICDNLPLDGLSPGALEALAERAQSLGIAVQVGTRGISAANLERHIALAERIGSPILRVVVDTASEHPSPEEVVAGVRPFLPRLARAGVTLAIENHDRFRAEVLRGIVERLGSEQVGICLDTVNSFGALEGPRAVVEALGPWVVNLHVKDFTIVRAPHSMGFVVEGRPAGEGLLDVPWLLGALTAQGRAPDAILEAWPPPQATVAETVRLEAAWAAQSVAYLRTLIPG